jgi:high-affinity K+ transport system ATPase subunit B
MARRLRPDGSEEPVPGTELHPGDRVVVEANQVIPGDGEVVEGGVSRRIGDHHGDRLPSSANRGAIEAP